METDLVHDISELHHADPDQPVVPAEAVVLHGDVELVGGHLLLVADNAGEERRVLVKCYWTALW